MSDGPRVLVVTSAGAPPSVSTPVLAALEALGLGVRALDVGRIGTRSPGAAWRVLRALSGELAERRLQRELEQHPPEVTLAFDPTSAGALAAARDASSAPAPVVAIVPELEPVGAEWASAGADRYLTVDEDAAAALADEGVEGDRVLAVGPFCPLPYAQAGREARAAVRERFKLTGAGAVVLVEVAGLGYDTTSQLAMQLSLSSQSAVYLFAAGDDVDAATALRRQVPTLGIKAKLFGNTRDAPLLWRTADVVVARARHQAVAKAMAVGAKLVAFSPDDGDSRALVDALEARRMGAGAQGPLFVASALDALLAGGGAAATSGVEGEDGAGNAADVIWVIGKAAREIIGEARASERAETRARVQAASQAARSAERETSAAGDLEDLGGGEVDDGPAPPSAQDLERLRRDLEVRAARAQRTVSDSQQSADRWRRKAEEARTAGADAGAREAARNSELELARMHAALAELAELEAERKSLAAAAAAGGRARPSSPPGAGDAGRRAAAAGSRTPGSTGAAGSVDDQLRDLKRQGGGATRTAGKPPNTVDDELEALKRKMSSKKRDKP